MSIFIGKRSGRTNFTAFQKAVFLALGIALIFLYWFIPPVHKFSEAYIHQTRWLRSTSETVVKVGPKAKGWVSLGETSKHFIHSVISAEDSRFFEHEGIDLKEIWKSFKLNLSKGKYARGASTITQQVVKLGVLSSDKNLIRKSRESVGAILLETSLSKKEILSWYINLADFGSGVYGIKDAAWYYFQTTPDKLTVSESIHLALVLPAPNTWSEGLKQKLLTEFGRRRFMKLLGELYNNGYITKHQFEIANQTGNFGRPISSVVGN